MLPAGNRITVDPNLFGPPGPRDVVCENVLSNDNLYEPVYEALQHPTFLQFCRSVTGAALFEVGNALHRATNALMTDLLIKKIEVEILEHAHIHKFKEADQARILAQCTANTHTIRFAVGPIIDDPVRDPIIWVEIVGADVRRFITDIIEIHCDDLRRKALKRLAAAGAPAMQPRLAGAVAPIFQAPAPQLPPLAPWLFGMVPGPAAPAIPLAVQPPVAVVPGPRYFPQMFRVPVALAPAMPVAAMPQFFPENFPGLPKEFKIVPPALIPWDTLTDAQRDTAINDFKMPTCSITGELIQDPVQDTDGHIFERSALRDWFIDCKSKEEPFTCPLSRVAINVKPMPLGTREAWTAICNLVQRQQQAAEPAAEPAPMSM